MNRLLWCAMDLNYSKEELAFRDEVSGWLADKLPADLRDKVVRYAWRTQTGPAR